jgi:hypothetical protein
MDYSVQEIQEKVHIALGVLFKNDVFLLENGVHERSIPHKLGEYLQDKFPDWHVDCEYNKKGRDNKKLDGIRECPVQKATDRIYPDIIVHTRNTDKNLLAIEIKTNNPRDPCDVKKLKLLTKPDNGYEYTIGLYVRFNRLNRPVLEWFKSGKRYEAAE